VKTVFVRRFFPAYQRVTDEARFPLVFPVSKSPIIKDSLKMMQKRVVSVENVEYPIENSFISFNLHRS